MTLPNWKASLLLAAFLAPAAMDPLVDTAGPLTVRIQGPREVTRTGVPLPLTVTIENSGGVPISGTLELRVIDHWRAAPSAAAPFQVEAQGRVRLAFTVTAGEGTHNASYPIHAVAEFEAAGKRLTAHPILTVPVRTPTPPAAPLPVEWKPLETPARGAMGLWRLPIHRARVTVVQEELTVRAAARTSVEDQDSTIQFDERTARGAETREGFSILLGLRPPALREKVAAAWVEYPLALTKAQPIRLRFASGADEGVMFRVRVARFDAPPSEPGAIVFERRSAVTEWQSAEADLSRFAGQAIRLQLEAEAGPGKASGRAYWGEPTLVSGAFSSPPPFPAAPQTPWRALGVIERQGVRYEVRLWPGRRGMLDATLGFIDGSKKLLFHGFQVRVLGDALEDSSSSSELAEVREEASPGRYRVRHRFRSWAGRFDLVTDAWVEKGALHTRFALENTPPLRPWLSIHLEDVAAGAWSERAVRVYAGPGNVMQDPKAFRLKANGHYMATSYVGLDFPDAFSMVQAVDAPVDHLWVDPEMRSYSLHTPHAQTMTFIPSASVWTAAQTWRDIHNPRPASGVAKLSGRFVFDLWGGGYGETAEALRKAFRYGLTDSAVIFHNWQHWGYDYRLPDIYPPNLAWGTQEAFADLANTCRKNGALFAPHDNYMDFYPDSEGFTYDNIAFTADGRPQTAWLQGPVPSYHPRSDLVLPFVQRNIRQIKDGFAPSAYFIDVWSSEPPYDYYTSDGRFFDRVYTRDIWKEGFAWIRNTLGEDAPQISEAGADQYIGWLDGGTAAQMRAEAGPERSNVWRIETSDTERIPWFDAAYHDRFALHGAGYEGRYDSGQDARAHGMYSDDYLTTEVLTGHPPMVSAPFGRDVVRKYWLLHDLMRALALRPMQDFEFAAGNLHRQRVGWEGGGEAWVNRGNESWTAAGRQLPDYGYYARAQAKDGVVESAIERRDGQIVEWSRSASLLYVNARPAVLDARSPRAGGGGRSPAAGPDPRIARMNPDNKLVSFGAVTTNGGFRLGPEGGAIQLTPLPSSPRFQARIRWSELPWKVGEPKQAESLGENGKVVGAAPLRQENGEIVLDCEPGVFAYRLR